MDNPAFSLEINEEKTKNGQRKDEYLEQAHSFEEAISLTGSGKYHYFLLVSCGICFMVVMIETMGISVILPFLKCDIKSTIAEQGFLASSGFLGIVLSSHAVGFLADTWGRVKTLRAALLCCCVTGVISGFSVNIWMLIVFRFLNGFCISGCQACVFSFVGEFHGNKTRVRYVTLLSMFLPIALMILPGMAVGILPLQLDITVLGLDFKPWRILILANSIISLIAYFGMLLMPESPKYDLIQGKHEEAMKTLRLLFRVNTGRPENEYPVKRVNVELSGASLSNIHGIKDALSLIWSQTAPLFYKERVFHTLNICCIMFVIYAAAQGLFMWFPTMLDQLVAKNGQGYTICEIMYDMGTTLTNSSVLAEICDVSVDTGMFLVLIYIGAAFTGIFLVFAFTIDIIGKKNLLKVWFAIALVCCLAIHWATSFILTIIILTLTMGVGNCGGIVSTISVEYFPTNISAMAMCLIMMIGRLGAVVGSNLVGLTIYTQCDALFYVYVGLIVLILLLSLFLPDKEKAPKTIKLPTQMNEN